jgi:hypothetical protein
MTARILPPSDWPRLAGTEVESLWPRLDPLLCHVLVVEEGDRIVGTWALMPIMHAECLWIAPDKRKSSSVARRLWRQLQGVASELGITAVATAAQTDDVRGLLEHVGAMKLVGDHYIMRIPCPQP